LQRHFVCSKSCFRGTAEDLAVLLERREIVELIRAFVDQLRSELPKSDFRLLKLRWLEDGPSLNWLACCS